MSPYKPKSLRRVRYTVKGRGYFPHDMLRYDRARPAQTEDIQWINAKEEERELMLETYLAPGIRRGVEKDGTRPCVDRWRSFGWEVTEIYPVERIALEEVPQVVLEDMLF